MNNLCRGDGTEIFRRSRWTTIAVYACLSLPAFADTLTLSVADANRGSSNVTVPLAFPVVKSGDIQFNAVIGYHTADASAHAGSDYLAQYGSLLIPAGSSAGNVNVDVLPNTANDPPRSFQLVVDSATGVGPVPAFAAAQPFATAGASDSMAFADVNGDGRADVLVANDDAGLVSVLLNVTAPGASIAAFAAGQNFAVGAHPASAVFADLNGDGKSDIVVANSNDATISVLLNTTPPGAAVASFATQQTFASGTNPLSIAIADMDTDGKPDVLVLNRASSSIWMLRNTTISGVSTASFAAPQILAVPDGTSVSLTTVDLNGDGKPDLVVTGNALGSVAVSINTTPAGSTSISLADAVQFAVGSGPVFALARDLNGDGKPDLVVANANDDTVSTLVNTTPPGATSASFAAPQIFATAADPHWVAATDTNGDGKPDLLVAAGDAGAITLLQNTTAAGAANLSFSAAQNLPAGSAPVAIGAVDVNGDGKPDLVAADFVDHSITTLLNITATPAAVVDFPSRQEFAAGTSPGSTALGDLNGDGKPDIVIANRFAPSSLSVLLNTTPSGATVATFAPQFVIATEGNFNSVVLADMDHDGKLDIVAAAGFSAMIYLNTTPAGSDTLSFATAVIVPSGPERNFTIGVADLNGDGLPDLFTTNYGYIGDGQSISIALNNSARGVAIPTFAGSQTLSTGNGPQAIVAVDINGDGKPDLIVTDLENSSPSYGEAIVFLNTTEPGATVATFASKRGFITNASNGAGTPTSIVTADFNGDGKPDFAVTNTSAGYGSTVAVFVNTTTTGAMVPSFFARQEFSVASGAIWVTVADANGDGRPDLVVSSDSGNAIYLLTNKTVAGSSSTSFTSTPFSTGYAAGARPFTVAAGDINGDGRPDMLVADLTTNSVSVLLNSQYQCLVQGSPALGTIVHDLLFTDGFDSSGPARR